MTAIDGFISVAKLSGDGRYRYSLVRAWTEGPRLCFVMLNPSTADAVADDPTIRRCMGFARREGLAGIEVVNLYALRATDPREMRRALAPIGGAENDASIEEAAERAGKVVAAWGTHAEPRRAAFVVETLTRVADVWCLGLTKDGAPRHPLYLQNAAPLQLYRARRGA